MFAFAHVDCYWLRDKASFTQTQERLMEQLNSYHVVVTPIESVAEVKKSLSEIFARHGGQVISRESREKKYGLLFLETTEQGAEVIRTLPHVETVTIDQRKQIRSAPAARITPH
jgi:hypothetical protein